MTNSTLVYLVKMEYVSEINIFCLENDGEKHGLRTPNEGISQKYLKKWADVANKICFGRT